MIEKMSMIRDQYSFCWRYQSNGINTNVCFEKMNKNLKLICSLHRLILRLLGCVLSKKSIA